MAKSRSYQKDLLSALQNADEAVEYLNAALEDGEPEVFLLALKDVVDSHGGMNKLATSTSLNRENLYRMLSTKGNPKLKSLRDLVRAMGMQLTVRQLPPKRVL
jgi:probable addiction module antidote protein